MTGLRWGAAFIVFAYHVHNFDYFGGTGGDILAVLVAGGTAGVSFFFVLSGFVLAWSSQPSDTAPRFWRRRFARIYPLHLTTAALALGLAATAVTSLGPTSAAELIANLFLVSSWNPAWWQALNPVSWSLVCEAFFYLLFPLLIRWLRLLSPSRLRAVIAGCLTAVVALPFLAPLTPAYMLYSWPPARLPEFIIGICTGLLVREGQWVGPGRTASWCAALGGFLLAPLAPAAFTHAAFTIFGITMLIPAIALADVHGRRGFWASRPLVRLGEASYAFYLVHLLVIRSVAALWLPEPELAPLPAAGLTAAVLTSALLLAFTLHIGVEKPARRLIMTRRRHTTGEHSVARQRGTPA